MTKAELHHLVDELPDDVLTRLEHGDAVTLTLVAEAGRLVAYEIDPDQAWFWTPEWQAKERAVDEGLARGDRGRIYRTDEEFLAALDELAERP